ncbi:MAG: PBS lyase [Roseiflexus castenholzii]|nr:MAG: PBS lyase [Roseiflexus castenholzii]
MDLAAHLRTLAARERLSKRELRSLSGLDPHDHATVWTEWQRIPAGRRIEIAHAMVELAEDNIDLDFTVMFQWLLDDADATVRASAIEGLWECDGLPVLRRMQVRAAAAMALGRFAYMAEIEEIDAVYGQQVHDALLALIRDPAQPTEVRRRAIESAGYFAASDAVQQQIELAYASSDQLMRESALTAMGRSMLPRWLPIVSRELESPSPALRYEAARAAGEMADLARSLVARVVRLCNDADTEVALAAIWALGQIGGETARRTLQRMSGSDDEARSQAAAEALDELTLEEGFSGGDWRNN